MPSKADEIRAYALQQHVRPWRRSNEKRLSIRAGHVVRGMRLRNSTPNVCSALGSRKFQTEAAIVLVHREGPRQSTTTTFHYEAAPAASRSPPRPVRNSAPRSIRARPAGHRLALDQDGEWRTADLFLVSCVGQKCELPAQARDLYISSWFKKARSCVEETGCPWFILSAKYGLLDPNSKIAPYNRTLKTMSANHRRAWASDVMEDLTPHIAGVHSVTFFAGMAYREFLGPQLHQRGLTVYVPMKGLGIGRQLSWLSKQARS